METEQKIFVEESVYEEMQAQEEKVQESMRISTHKKSFIERIIPSVLIGFVFLIPIFFLPLNGIFSGFAKNMLLSVVVISTFILTVFLWIKKGSVALPKSFLFYSLFFLIAAYSFSSLFSGSFSNSFFGLGGEITSSFEMLLLGVLLFLTAMYFKTKERILYAFIAVLASSFLVFLFQLFHFAFPGLTAPLGISPDKTANLIGSWGDLGAFSGIIALLSLVTLEKLPISGKIRGALYFFLVISLFFHAMVLYSCSWIILGIIALSLSVHSLLGQSKHTKEGDVSVLKRWVVSPSFIVTVLSFAFIFTGNFVNTKLFAVMSIPPVQDVRPSWSGTGKIFLGVFAEHDKKTIFGVGPNRFFIPWQKYRPMEVNYTPWWSVDFNEGVGTIPSSLVTTGILGFLAWVSFLLIFFFGGLRSLRKRFGHMDVFTQYSAVATFVVSVYCWTVAFTSSVGVVPFAFAFLFTGLFLGVLSISGISSFYEVNFLKNSQTGFTFVIILIALLAMSSWVGWNSIERARSSFAFRHALIFGEAGKVEQSAAQFQKAISLAPNDSFYRSLSVLNSYQTQQILLSKTITPEQLREQLGVSFRSSIDMANKAVAFDRANYRNWIALGNAYSVLAPLGIKNVSDESYAQTKAAYEQASKLNPFNPQIPYTFAQIALLKNLPDEAVSSIKRAIKLKSDYTEALVLLSQIEDSNGHPDEALAAIEGSAAFNFSDPTILFQVGYLRYKNGNYDMAVSALEKAVQTIPDYSNAKYFLGLSYFKFGRVDDALKQFQDIQRLNPGRTDIPIIISNLQKGYAPLSVQ